MKPEIVAPAGDMEKLKAAILYGADAVYLGGRHFGLRSGASNFNEEELRQGVSFAHDNGARVYVTVNVYASNKDLKMLPGYLNFLAETGVDGVIVADPGIVYLIKQLNLDLKVHLSTQANTTNWAAALFWKDMGVSRIVLARELSFYEIKNIKTQVPIELEVFVHGAMCIAYSGRCLLSSYLTGRSANQGDCSQSCRWRYFLLEEKRPGEYLPVEEDERGTYVLSSRDLCLIEYIPQLVGAGISGLKIEGRMKSVNYVAGTVKAYREALDTYFRDPDNYLFNKEWLAQLAKVSHRDFITGFFCARPGQTGQHYHEDLYRREQIFAGIVRDYNNNTGLAMVEQRNRFAVGDHLEIMVPGSNNFTHIVKRIIDHEGNSIDAAPHPQQLVFIPIDRPVPPFSIIRRIVHEIK